MVASRLSNSIGLASNSSHPVAMAFSRSLSTAYADMPMIGMSRVCGSLLRRRTASQRSLSGISRSIRITSGCSRGQHAALLAVLRCEHLEAAAQLEARLEHVQVVVVVFDVEHFGHVADSVLLTAALITSSLDHLVGAGEQRLATRGRSSRSYSTAGEGTRSTFRCYRQRGMRTVRVHAQ